MATVDQASHQPLVGVLGKQGLALTLSTHWPLVEPCHCGRKKDRTHIACAPQLQALRVPARVAHSPA